MLVALFLTLTLLLAFTALRLFYRSVRAGLKTGWPRFLLAMTLSGFVQLYGAWVYLSTYMEGVFCVVAVLTVIAAQIISHRNLRPHPARKALYLPLALLFLVLDILYFTGTTGTPAYADLRFPLKQGRYYVLQGGKGLPANVFHYNARGAVYAIDLVRLDRWGRRCTKVFSSKLEDYYIFGDTIYAPCAGRIERAVSDNPDNIPPLRKRGPNNLNGVVLRGNAYTVYLGHLQQGKVFVDSGQTVVEGQPLGLVGNSGMSLEPHLHIQVHRNAPEGEGWYRQPQLFVRFGGKEYLLFEAVEVQ